MTRNNDPLEDKIRDLVNFLLKHRNPVNGSINLETGIVSLTRQFHLGNDATTKMLYAYYYYNKEVLSPRVRGFKPTFENLLKEYHYQNQRIVRKYIDPTFKCCKK